MIKAVSEALPMLPVVSQCKYRLLHRVMVYSEEFVVRYSFVDTSKGAAPVDSVQSFFVCSLALLCILFADSENLHFVSNVKSNCMDRSI